MDLTPLYILLAIVAVIALGALLAHFLPKAPVTDPVLKTVQDDLNWLYERAFPPHAGVTGVTGTVAVPPPNPKYPPGTVLQGTGMTGVVQGDGTVLWTTTPPAGMVMGKNGALVQPCTPEEVFAAMKTVSTSQGVGFQLGINWNQLQYLKELSTMDLSAWFAKAKVSPTITADPHTYDGFIQTLAVSGVSVP